MKRRPPVDEIRVARLDRERDRLARDHPEAFERVELVSTPDGLARALGARIGRPPSDDPGVVVTVRLPRSLLVRLDAAVADNSAVTRTEAIRSGIERWLKAERRRR